jgi:hypothetical protein
MMILWCVAVLQTLQLTTKQGYIEGMVPLYGIPTIFSPAGPSPLRARARPQGLSEHPGEHPRRLHDRLCGSGCPCVPHGWDLVHWLLQQQRRLCCGHPRLQEDTAAQRAWLLLQALVLKSYSRLRVEADDLLQELATVRPAATTNGQVDLGAMLQYCS